MPDVLAMPYRPQIFGAEEPGVYDYTYRLGGITCLAGDVIGDYSLKPTKSRRQACIYRYGTLFFCKKYNVQWYSSASYCYIQPEK